MLPCQGHSLQWFPPLAGSSTPSCGSVPLQRLQLSYNPSLYEGEPSPNSCDGSHCPELVSPNTRATGTLLLSQTKSQQCSDLVAKVPSATRPRPLLSQDASPAAGGTPSSECNPPSRFAAKSSSLQPTFEPPRPWPQLATNSSGCIFPSESLKTSLPSDLIRVHKGLPGFQHMSTHARRQTQNSILNHEDQDQTLLV